MALEAPRLTLETCSLKLFKAYTISEASHQGNITSNSKVISLKADQKQKLNFSSISARKSSRSGMYTFETNCNSKAAAYRIRGEPFARHRKSLIT